MSPTFCWLTPAAPAALAVIRLDAAPGPLRHWPATDAVSFTVLRDHAGTAIDEVVAVGRPAGAELCCHGGPGLRLAVNAALIGHGYQEVAAAIDDPWSHLARTASPAATHWRLRHGMASPPFLEEYLYRSPLVLITGPANAGKSTLLNALCGWRRALVSALPGTTRDLVAAETLAGGWRLRLLDSAGLRATDDTLELAGQALVTAARRRADLVLYLAPADDHAPCPDPKDLVVMGKADLAAAPAALAWSAFGLPGATPEVLAERVRLALVQRLGLPQFDRKPGQPEG